MAHSRLFLRLVRPAVVLCLLCLSLPARAQQWRPGIGYLYPAGGQRGTVVRVTVGGQNLRKPTDIIVSGQGVRAEVVEYTGAFRFLQRPQQWLLVDRLWKVREQRLKDARLPIKDVRAILEADRKRWPWKMLDTDVDTDAYKLPGHPMLIDLESRSLSELAHIQSMFFFPRAKLQDNRQLAEHVLIEITIAPNAEPGVREVRLRTGNGISNPMRFEVGRLPEVTEAEPNNKTHNDLPGLLPRLADLLKTEPLALPVLINGQVMPGDIDRFRFHARQDQQLEIRAAARSLIPYLADAVPGWFQAVLSLYDAAGNEIAFADDTLFNPDPVIRCRVPTDGVYELAIRDSIHRGRQDFIYRISVNTDAQTVPVSSRTRVPEDVFASGINSLQTPTEKEPNDDLRRAGRTVMPRVVAGRIGHPGDVDLYRFDGRAGQSIVAEVYARRLGSPLDSLLRLLDASGQVLAWNDDYVLKEKHLHIDHVGVVTHHADSVLTASLPRDGRYYVQISDAQRHGGAEYGYQLRISPPRPDFALRVTPSGLATRPGGVLPVTVYALRRDGFDGAIKVVLKNEPAGTRLDGGIVPAGVNQVRMTVTAPPKAPKRPISLELEGRARIGGEQVHHAAVPADNVMQAFLWRHLVPADELVFVVKEQRWSQPVMTRSRDETVRLSPGGNAPLQFRGPRRRVDGEIFLEIDDPPPGITLNQKSVRMREGNLQFTLAVASGADVKPFKGNLVIEIIREYLPKRKDGTQGKLQRQSVGFLPAIPVELAL